MKNYLYSVIAILLLAISCNQDHATLEEAQNDYPVVFSVRTTTAQVSSPVLIYIFKGDVCVKSLLLSPDREQMTVSLEKGVYDVYAIGGIDDQVYTLPIQSSMTRESPISLISGIEHHELMHDYQSLSVTKDGGRTVAFSMKRKVGFVSNIEISGIPATATSVKVSISSFYPAITVDGNPAGDLQDYVVELTKQDDKKWSATPNVALIPNTSANPAITFIISDGNVTKKYTYAAQKAFSVNAENAIKATYNVASYNFTFSFTIIPLDEKNEQDITINEDEGEEVTEDNPESGTGTGTDDPTSGSGSNGIDVGSIYKTCCVIAKSGNKLTLLAPKKFTPAFSPTGPDNVNNQMITISMGNYSIDGIIASWRAMKRTEAEYVFAHYLDINNAFSETDDKFVEDGSYAFYDESVTSTDHYRHFILSGTDFNSSVPSSFNQKSILFPVTEVTIDSE